MTFLSLSAQIEGQLREAYDRRHVQGEVTQASLAKKLSVNKSAIHHRLMGHTNMTLSTVADMVWALDCAIKVEIFDPKSVSQGHHFMCADAGAPSSEQIPNGPSERPLPQSSQTLPKQLADIIYNPERAKTLVTAP